MLFLVGLQHDETQFTKKGFNKRKGSSLVVNPFGGGSKKVPPSPSEILRDITNNYCRNADSLTKLQLYKAEVRTYAFWINLIASKML